VDGLARGDGAGMRKKKKTRGGKKRKERIGGSEQREKREPRYTMVKGVRGLVFGLHVYAAATYTDRCTSMYVCTCTSQHAGHHACANGHTRSLARSSRACARARPPSLEQAGWN